MNMCDDHGFGFAKGEGAAATLLGMDAASGVLGNVTVLAPGGTMEGKALPRRSALLTFRTLSDAALGISND